MDVFKKDLFLKQIASQINTNEHNIGVSVKDLYE